MCVCDFHPCLDTPAGDFQFEEAMLTATKCQIHTFDCTYDGRAIHPTRHHYHKLCIGSQNRNSFRTWTNITRALGHPAVHLLKCDIEGFEYPLLAQFHPGDVLPSEISIEFHAASTQLTGSLYPATAGQLALAFSHLANLGYAAYSQEVNPQAATCCSEFTFMRLPALPAAQ